MNSSVKSDTHLSYDRRHLYIGIGLAMLTLLMMVSVLNRPSLFVYQNYDDAFYSSIGVQLAANGDWRPAFQPLGLVPSESYFAANPVLTPYFTAASIKFFGPSRWAFKLPSLVAFLVAGLALIWMLHIAKASPEHCLVVLFSYFASPWLYFAMNTARAEPLCIGGLYIAMLFVLIGANSTKPAHYSGWLLLSGAFSALVAWNHVLFSMAALLPALAILFYADKTNRRKGVLLWFAGAFLTLVILAGLLILPYVDSWKEQFLANASNNADISERTKPVASFESLLPFPLNELVELKARASSLGWPFICWYAGVPLLFLVFLRPTRLFFASLFLLLAWLAVIELKTPVLATYVVNIVIALPLCLMFAASKPRDNRMVGAATPLLIFFVVSVTILHAWLVLRPATRISDWSLAEQQLEEEFSVLPPRSIIWGGDIVQGMVPAWKQGHTYYYTSWNFLYNVPGVTAKLEKLAAEQAGYRVDNESGEWQVMWQGSRKRGADASGDQK